MRLRFLRFLITLFFLLFKIRLNDDTIDFLFHFEITLLSLESILINFMNMITSIAFVTHIYVNIFYKKYKISKCRYVKDL
jgi:hypothetical protein